MNTIGVKIGLDTGDLVSGAASGTRALDGLIS
jgi:hypothetical protein